MLIVLLFRRPNHFSTFKWGRCFLFMRRTHLTRSCASSPDNSLSDKSFLMLSNHFRFDLPVLLFPGTSITTTLMPTYSSSLLNTRPYHFNLFSCTFLDISHTFVVLLILSFPILSSLATPLIHLNILISATSNVVLANSYSPRTVERYMPSHRIERLSISTQIRLPTKLY